MTTKKQKTGASSLPPDFAVWAGWSHFDKSRKDIQDPKIADAALDLGASSEQLLVYLAAIHGVKPDVLGVPARDLMIDDDCRLRIMNALREAADPYQTFRVLRRFLEVIDAGRRIGRFRMAIPHLPAPDPPQQASPFQHEDFERMIEFNPTRAAFEKSLEQTSALSVDAQWGQIMFSALVYGGLLKTKWLLAIPAALAEAEPEMRWIVLKPPAPTKEKAAQAPKRYFPDPLTRLLLIKAKHNNLGPIKAEAREEYRLVMKLIHAYGDERNITGVLKDGFRSISKPVATSLHLYLPGWLVGYAAERQQSTSLPDWSWDRLILPPSRIATELIHRERLLAAAVPNTDVGDWDDTDSDGEADDDVWPSQLRELGSLILEGDSGLRTRIQEWRLREKGNLLPSVNLLAKWATDKLLKSGRGWHPRKFRTVYGMINAGGSRLVAQLGTLDPRELSEDVLLETYQNALEDAPSVGVRRKVARALKSFHEFLVVNSIKEATEARKNRDPSWQKRLVPSLAESGVFVVIGKSGGNVDANLIGLDTFFRAAVWLRNAAGAKCGERIADSLSAIASLGYFGGLRRSEGIGCSIGDILWARNAIYVEIRKNSLRGVKSRSANRILPMMLLMPPEAKKALIAWADKRLAETKDPSQPLFPDFVRKGIANDKDVRLNLITEALQRAANDETLRFHHLRHSFANWLLVKFVVAELGGIGALPDWFLPTQHDRNRWRIAAYERDLILGSTRISRRALLQISHLLGHSGSDITLGSYIHLADFILGLFIRRLTPELTDKALVALTGTGLRNVAKSRHDAKARSSDAGNRNATLITELGDRMVSAGRDMKKVIRSGKVDFSTPPPVEVPKTPSQYILHVGHALNLLNVDLVNAPQVANITGIDAKSLKELYKCLAALPSGATLMRKRSSGSGDKALLDLPTGDMQIEMVTRTIDILGKLVTDGIGKSALAAANRKKLEVLLEKFPQHWVPGTYLTLRFESPPDARRWIWFLDQIGLKGGVLISHIPGKGAALPSAERQRLYWEGRLPVKVVSDGTKQKTATTMTRGVVEIAIDPGRIKDKKMCNFNKHKGLFGVRFALIMANAVGLRKLVTMW